jgi:hypothetical protein
MLANGTLKSGSAGSLEVIPELGSAFTRHPAFGQWRILVVATIFYEKFPKLYFEVCSGGETLEE